MTQFVTGVMSDIGGRALNEDAFGFHADNGCGCWVLADGLGGHGGGQTAARVAVEAVLESFHTMQECSPMAVSMHLESAAARIRDCQTSNLELRDMRTTAVVLVADTSGAVWGHIGDSRLYMLRSGRVVSQTRDHSVPQSLVDAGEITPAEIRFHEDRNRLLRSLGNGGRLRAALLERPMLLNKGDAFLLCSDGFWEYVTETEMEVDFAKARTPDDWLDRMAVRIRPRAHEARDNCTALAVFIDGV